MALIEEAKPIVWSPIIGTYGDCLLESLFRRIQLVELLVRIGQASVRQVVRWLQLHSLAILLNRFLVAARAGEYSARADVRFRKRCIPRRAPLALLYRRVRPRLIVRQLIRSPVALSEARIRCGKAWVFSQRLIENLDRILNVFELHVILQVPAPL